MSGQDKKFNCAYQEKCFRKNPSHFKQFSHPHLDKILEMIGEDEIHVPVGYIPMVSYDTIRQQLAFCRAILESGETSTTSKEGARNNSKKESESESSCSSACTSSPPKKQRLMDELNSFRKQYLSDTGMSVKDKLKGTEPYNILYTGLARASGDSLSVTLPELFDASLGDLESSLTINFMVEFGWLLASLFSQGHRGKPLTLIYGECDEDLQSNRFSSFLTHKKIKPPSTFGCHHTKMMIISYLDSTIRVVVCTANLVESDWHNKTQGVWISPKCNVDPSYVGGGESSTHFKKQLLRYLKAYNTPELAKWIEKVNQADFSAVKVFFVASVPGSHSSVEPWGQLLLRSLLRKHAPAPENNSYNVIAQVSSIGSLGATPEAWLLGDIYSTFSANKQTSTLTATPSINVVYPTFKNVENSADGLLGGGCLPYTITTHSKQPWLRDYMRQWKSDKINRSKAVPHIKSYTRISPDMTKISYFLLTSANLSKAAWGTLSKKGTVNILSYEAGVLLLPEFLTGEDHFPLVSSTNGIPIFTLPYDIPLKSYEDNDVPWFFENLTQ